MKKLIILFAIALLMLALMVGCGQKAEQDTDKVPVEVKEADMADSTRMDSAMIDSAMEKVEGAVEDVKDAAKDAAEEAAGDYDH